MHRAIKINHATAAGRKDISVLNVKRRIQERKKEDWAFCQAESNIQTQNKPTRKDDELVGDNESIQSNCPSSVNWNGLLIGLDKIKQQSLHTVQDLEVRLKNCITLDNGSTLSLFSNPDLVTNIRTTRTTLALATNPGVKKSNQEAQVPGFGKVYYNKDAIANIFGFLDLKKKHIIPYNSDKEDTFIIHINDQFLKFECTPEGLYQYEVSKSYREDVSLNGTVRLKGSVTNGTSNLINTVAESRKGYALRQFECAKGARRLYHIVGTPTIIFFKALLRMNIIKNCPVTVEDVNIADQIFGPDMYSLKKASQQDKSQIQ